MLIDERLPAYISRVYAHDLQNKSLKEIQPQIVEFLDALLQEINAQEDIQIHYSSRSSYQASRSHRFYKAIQTSSSIVFKQFQNMRIM